MVDLRLHNSSYYVSWNFHGKTSCIKHSNVPKMSTAQVSTQTFSQVAAKKLFFYFHEN